MRDDSSRHNPRAQRRNPGEIQLHNERIWRISAFTDSPGQYTVTANAPGFKQAVREHLVVHVNDRARQDLLQLGDAAESVIVQIAAGAVQTESAEIKDVVQNQQVLDLPLKDREFLQLTLLSEGVVNPPGGTRGDSLQQTGALINVEASARQNDLRRLVSASPTRTSSMSS